jgi:Protein of unknown function (DUF3891)
MIVRKDANGQLLLIGQTDHSRLVGQLAAHWGNDRFATPRPYDSVARAAAFHDYGWLRYETQPIINEAGETPGFRHLPGSAHQLDAYQWCIDWMGSIDPYAGLIVGMHRTGLWRARYDTIDYPEMSIRKLGAETEEFIEKNEARQREAAKAFDPVELRTNYHLLQVWDLLGLYFCCQEPYDDYIEPVPLAYDGKPENTVRLSLQALGPRKVAFEPFPFARRSCEVQLAYRRLPEATYPHLDTFRRAYFQARVEVMNFELI